MVLVGEENQQANKQNRYILCQMVITFYEEKNKRVENDRPGREDVYMSGAKAFQRKSLLQRQVNHT